METYSDIKKSVEDKIYPSNFNIERTRYYGLRVGDRVKRAFQGNKRKNEIWNVYQYGFSDNNCIYLERKGVIIKWVAEWCKIIKRVKD